MGDQSVLTLNLLWNEKRFHQLKSQRDAARRSLFRASTGEMKNELILMNNVF